MPFTIRPSRRFPVPCAVTYNAGLFQGQDTVWNLSCTCQLLPSYIHLRPGATLSLTVTLPNAQRIVVPEAVVRWSQGQEFGIETVETPKHTQARLINTCDDW